MQLIGTTLWADIDAGCIKLLLVVGFLAIGGINAIFKKMNEAKAEAARKAAQNPFGPPRTSRQVDDELEQFLRQAQHRGPAIPPPPPQPRPVPQARPPQPRPAQPARGDQGQRGAAAQRPRPGQKGPPPVPRSQPPSLPPLENLGPMAMPASPRLEQRHQLEDHIQQRLNTSEFEERARELGHVDETRGQLEAHVHQSLDHRIGTLGSDELFTSQSGTVSNPVSPAAASLLNLLGSPQGIRSAILLSEVLQRPEHRWQRDR